MEQTVQQIIFKMWRDATVALTLWLGVALVLNQFTHGFVEVLWPFSLTVPIWLVNILLFALTARYYWTKP